MKYSFDEYKFKPINYLTPIKESEERSKDGSKQWEFECVCGNKILEVPRIVINGAKRSCGCIKRRDPVEIEKRIGEKYGRLTILNVEYDESKRRNKVVCKCDCGNITKLFLYQLTSGTTKSCGCFRTESLSSRKKDDALKRNHYHLYKKLELMKRRCYNKNNENYYRYGGRGITICDEWLHDSRAFIQWAEENGGLCENLTIDRIDNDGPYAPWNCRFVTPKQQSRNISTNHYLEYNGERKCMVEWAEITGLNRNTIQARIARGWPVEKALTVKPDTRNRISKMI